LTQNTQKPQHTKNKIKRANQTAPPKTGTFNEKSIKCTKKNSAPYMYNNEFIILFFVLVIL
jgi:hypothetical protein